MHSLRFSAPQGTRTVQAAAPGGTITVNVGPNDSSIQVYDPSTNKTDTHNVTPGKDTPIPLPHAPGGTILEVRIGKGLDARVLYVEIISTGA